MEGCKLLIDLDFSKLNRIVADYLREQVKKKSINRDGLLALTIAFEGIQIPCELTSITEKAEVNYEEIKAKIYAQDSYLEKATATLDFWFSINKFIGNELDCEETIKKKAATIIANCI
jgi:hypothetical protein